MSINHTITITLVDAPRPHENRPPEIRLRAVLKLLLRGYGLRCVNIRLADPDSEPEADNNSLADPPSKS